MKEVMAIIRMNKINKTKEALGVAGFPAVTCRKVFGRGKKKVNYELIQELLSGEELQSSTMAEVVSEGHRLIPKRLITLIVEDSDVKEVVDTIIEINKTGSQGDGKIFVLPITEAVRVRTGEKGSSAI
jgi:nitrogen regulatory protein PII 2